MRTDRLDIQAPGIGGPPDAYWKDTDTRMYREDIAWNIAQGKGDDAEFFWFEHLWNVKPDVVEDLYRLVRLMACADMTTARDMLLVFRGVVQHEIDEYARSHGK